MSRFGLIVLRNDLFNIPEVWLVEKKRYNRLNISVKIPVHGGHKKNSDELIQTALT